MLNEIEKRIMISAQMVQQIIVLINRYYVIKQIRIAVISFIIIELIYLITKQLFLVEFFENLSF